MTDLEAIRLQIVTHLPVRVRWLIEQTPLDFDFSHSQSPLLNANDFLGGARDQQWTALHIFGEQDYAEGGGATPFLGVHAESGEILGLDLDRDESQIYLLNSNIDLFIRTFLEFDEVLRLSKRPPLNIRERLKEIDPGAFERSEWLDLCNLLQ
jgi:hypothetical protein